jgi:DNA polymerase-2
VFEDGRIKMRGIEARRGDTPPFIEKAQIEMIKVLAKASDFEGFLNRVPEALSVLKEYASKLISGQVSVSDLLISKRLSMHPSDYMHDVFQAVAARQLLTAGFDVYPGQTVQYLIVDAENRSPNKRVKAVQLLNAKQKYDMAKYLDMLLGAGQTILGPFGYDLEKIRSSVIYGEKQLILS